MFDDDWLEAAYEDRFEYYEEYEDDRELYEQRLLAEDLEADLEDESPDDAEECM